jgi:hypothetical protein
MLRYDRIHKENIQIRRMICYNDIRSFWCFSVPYFFNRIKTKDTHHVGPKNKQIKTVVLRSRELNDN